MANQFLLFFKAMVRAVYLKTKSSMNIILKNRVLQLLHIIKKNV